MRGIKHYLAKPLDKDKILGIVEDIISAGKDFPMP